MSSLTYKSTDKIRNMTAAGVFCALAYVACVLFRFHLGFLTFDLKDAVMTCASMMFGPLYGIVICVVVSLIEMVTISTTGLYGLIMNVLSSGAFVCVGSAIYSLRRSMKGALVGMICSVAAMTGVMMAANLIVTPFYMGVTAKDVAGMIPTMLLPFNLTKAVFNAALVFLIYKPVSGAVRAAGFSAPKDSAPAAKEGETPEEAKRRARRRTLAVVVAAAAVAVCALLYFFLVLHGTFTLGEAASAS